LKECSVSWQITFFATPEDHEGDEFKENVVTLRIARSFRFVRVIPCESEFQTVANARGKASCKFKGALR
jgi:hypothetical protein